MSIFSATSVDGDTRAACAELVREARSKLRGVQPDLALLFASRHHVPAIDDVLSTLARELDPGELVGCTGEGIIGDGIEYEERPALTLWVAAVPGMRCAAGRLSIEQTPDGFAVVGVPEAPEGPATMLLFADPYSFQVEPFNDAMSKLFPDLQILGGISSGAREEGGNRLFWGGETFLDGAVAAVISGGVHVTPLVSQGCRPFGKHLVITKAEGNAIYELGGKPALEKLLEQVADASPAEREILEQGLHLGVAIDARKETHGRGDFLVRNVLGFAEEQEAIVVTDVVRPGMTVQFHMRDAATASEDLRFVLRGGRGEGHKALGALLFTCNGRGSRLFARPNHDAAAVQEEIGTIPVAGFFAAGEIGPVGGRSFLHGFTASVALFESGPA